MGDAIVALLADLNLLEEDKDNGQRDRDQNGFDERGDGGFVEDQEVLPDESKGLMVDSAQVPGARHLGQW